MLHASAMPETRYARRGDAHIAYQIIGDGPIEMVFVAGYNHVEALWEFPPYARFVERLASFGRLILFDKLGTGLSDPVPLASLPTLEEWMDDVRTVMDAAGSARAAVIANFEGGPMAILFAATYPERTRALVLVDTYARLTRDVDYPAGIPQQMLSKFLDTAERLWRTGYTLDWLAPSHSHDSDLRELTARWERLVASPGTVAALARMNWGVDARHVLPLIQAPTLVVHRADNRWIRVGHGRYLAEHIAGARYLELPGEDTIIAAGDQDAMVAEIQEFLTGARPAASLERVLATVLFTDIVDSTGHAAQLGDRRWRAVLDGHHRIIRSELSRFRGKLVKTTGDGVLATFDGPARAIECAHAIVHRMPSLGIDVRAGLHTGECELVGDDVGGIAVHIAARVVAAAVPGEVLTSSTVKDLVVGSGISFADRGLHELKGVPEKWQLFAVER